MTLRSNFLSNRTKIFLIHKLLPGLYQGFIQVCCKMLALLLFRDVIENVYHYNLFVITLKCYIIFHYVECLILFKLNSQGIRCCIG